MKCNFQPLLFSILCQFFFVSCIFVVPSDGAKENSEEYNQTVDGKQIVDLPPNAQPCHICGQSGYLTLNDGTVMECVACKGSGYFFDDANGGYSDYDNVEDIATSYGSGFPENQNENGQMEKEALRQEIILQISQCEREIENYKNGLESCTEGTITANQYQQMIAELEVKKMQLERQLNNL